MAKINFKLATEKLGTPGTGIQAINPGAGMSNAAQRISTPQINVHAADVKYSNLTPNTIQMDTIGAVLQGAAGFEQAWSEAAFRYNERNEQAQADEAVVEYDKKVRRGFTGYEDENGEFIPGYKSTKSKEATTEYSKYSSDLTAGQKDYLMSLPEGVRKKAALRIARITENTQQQAANHRVREGEVYQQEVQYKQKQNLMEKMKGPDGISVITSGELEEHLLNTYVTDEERAVAAGEILQLAVYNSYNTELANTGNQLSAVQKSMEMFEAGRDYLSEEKEEAIRFNLLNQERAAKKALDRDTIQAVKIAREQHAKVAPKNMADAISAGNSAALEKEIGTIRGLYKNEPEKIEEAIDSALLKAVYRSASGAGLPPEQRANLSINDKIGLAEQATSKLSAMYEDAGLDAEEADMRVQQYLYYELPDQLESAQKREDKAYMGSAFRDMLTMKDKGQPFQPMEPPKSMLPGNRDKFIKVQQDYIDDIANGVDTNKFIEHVMSGEIARAGQHDKPYSESEMDTMFDKVVSGGMNLKDYVMISKRNQLLKDPDSVLNKYKNSAEYDAGKKFISIASKNGFFLPEELPEKEFDNIGDITRIKQQGELEKARATNDLNDKMLQHYNSNQNIPFDVNNWWAEYTNTKTANEPTKGWFKKIFSGYGGNPRGSASGVAAGMMSGVVNETLFGNPELRKEVYGE